MDFIKMVEKVNYKIFLTLLKTIPIILSFIYFLNIILSNIGINLMILKLLGSVSILPLIFLYLSSYVFQFCKYHRMFLHYILFMNILKYLDYIFIFNIPSTKVFIILMIITFIFMIITLYKYLKDRKGGRLWQ